MKKILLSALIAMVCCSSVYAQAPQRGGKHPKMSPEKIVQRMDRALDLTDKQEKELTALYTDFFKDLKENKQETDRKALREQRKQQKVEFDKKLNEILTSEQQQKWAEIKKAQAEKRKSKVEKKSI